MKQMNKLTMGLLLFAFLISPTLFSQEAAPKATIMVVTTVHWNFDKSDGSQEEWAAIEKEYFDKVTSKNEYILRTNFLTHYFTADNSEAIWVNLYANWEDIEKANDRTNELVEAAWPDESARKKFFATQSSYYTPMHSDEIYTVLDGGKDLAEKPTTPKLYYVRVSEMAYPANGNVGERMELLKEYNDNVTFKNEKIQAYYMYRHMWGADNTNFTEVFVFDNLCDIEASFDRNVELTDAKWSEGEQKVMNETNDQYWTGKHGDYIWRNYPALMK